MKCKAIQLAKVNDLSPEEWRELRRKSLGGSDAAAVLGLNKFKSRLELYCDKKGLMPDKDENEAMREGHDLEEYVAKRFCEATGKKARRSGYMWRHPEHEFITANIDREIVGENALLECKTTNPWAKSDFEAGEVPPWYYVQCMHYLAVTGCDRAYLAVLVYSKSFYWYTIERDEKEIASLMEAETEFWKNHVEAEVPPIADGSDSSMEALEALYPDRDSEGEADLSEWDDDVKRLGDINKLIKKLEDEREQLKGELASALGEMTRGRSKTGTVSYTTQQRTSVNGQKLKKEYPDIYNQYSNTTTYKVLRVRENKAASL